mgnify:CR=1 FL=1
MRNSNGTEFILVTAILAIANIVKNTLGPSGLDKMMVDDIGDITITNDGKALKSRRDYSETIGRGAPGGEGDSAAFLALGQGGG